MINAIKAFPFAVSLALLAGCLGYTWTSGVPESRRTIAVPAFENRTTYAEFGATATKHVLREIQREGTFKIRDTGDSALELQGSITRVTLNGIDYDRGYDRRASEYRMRVTVECSLIDKVENKVLFDNRKFVGETTFLSQRDVLTGQRNASDRVAVDLARQIVDGVLAQYAVEPEAPKGE